MSIIAGVYFHEDIVEGSVTAALVALMMLIPFLFMRHAALFRKAANVLVVGAGLFIGFTILKGAACPHYWEVALPFFLAIGTLLLGIARFWIGKGFNKELCWYAVLIFGGGLIWGVSWVADIRSVIAGERTTREEFRARITNPSDSDGAIRYDEDP